MKLIDKDALVAEIEKELNTTRKYSTEYVNGKKYALKKILSFLDQLDVKEVDLDFMLHEYWNLSSKITIDCLESATMTKDEMINFAKHFFGLGLKAQKEE